MARPKKQEILDHIDEFCSKVWYNRSFNRTPEDYKRIAPHILEGMLKSRQKVEFAYPEVVEGWSDFEWGMLNGKLSALRWVMGDEWDMLDT